MHSARFVIYKLALQVTVATAALTSCNSGEDTGSSRDPRVKNASVEKSKQTTKGCASLVGAQKTTLYGYTGIIAAKVGNSLITCSGTFTGHNVFFTAGHCISRADPLTVRYLGNADIPASQIGAKYNQSIKSTNVIHHGTSYIGMEMDLNNESVRTRDFAIVIFPDNTAPEIVSIASARPPAGSAVRLTSYGNSSYTATVTQDRIRWTGTNILEDFSALGTSMPAISASTSTQNANDVLAVSGDSGGGIFFDDKLFAVMCLRGTRNATTAFNLLTDINSSANRALIEEAKTKGAKIGVSPVAPGPAPAPAPAPDPTPNPPPSNPPVPTGEESSSTGAENSANDESEDLSLEIDSNQVKLLPMDESDSSKTSDKDDDQTDDCD